MTVIILIDQCNFAFFADLAALFANTIVLSVGASAAILVLSVAALFADIDAASLLFSSNAFSFCCCSFLCQCFCLFFVGAAAAAAVASFFVVVSCFWAVAAFAPASAPAFLAIVSISPASIAAA